jgi:hypothetical protein
VSRGLLVASSLYRPTRNAVDCLSTSQARNLVAFNVREGKLHVSFSIGLVRL